MGARRPIGRFLDSSARGRGFEICIRDVVFLSKTNLLPEKIIPSTLWLHTDMTENLLIQTLSINPTTNQNELKVSCQTTGPLPHGGVKEQTMIQLEIIDF